ncbi:MAG TPA: PQQ-binding-like beta-propeller repeat protein [Candidatus Acidoferrales bacterium]
MNRFLKASLVVLLFSGGSQAQEWAQWRGPGRDGVVAASSVPAAWPASADKLKAVWRVEVGEGYSSPVVAGGRIYIHSRRDPQETVLAVDLASGKILWQKTYKAPFKKNSYAAKMAKGPNSTPLVAGGRVYTLGVTAVLSAWDAQTGELVWRKDYSSTIDTSKMFCGTSMSPLIEGGALIVQVGSDIHGGRVLALDPATGAERWAWTGAGPGYASPIVITSGGVRQIVTLTNGSMVGINAKSGATLWTAAFPDEWHENIVTPVWTGTHLVVSGVRQGTHAYTLRNSEGKWEAAQAWRNADVTMYMSSPVAADGVLYAHSNKKKGQFVALDVATGAVRWATEGRAGWHASVLLTPKHVVYLTNDANLVIVPRSPEKFAETARYEVAQSETFAVPVLLADGLLVRDATGLARLTLSR